MESYSSHEEHLSSNYEGDIKGTKAFSFCTSTCRESKWKLKKNLNGLGNIVM
jgi:hypothetical protein